MLRRSMLAGLTERRNRDRIAVPVSRLKAEIDVVRRTNPRTPRFYWSVSSSSLWVRAGSVSTSCSFALSLSTGSRWLLTWDHFSVGSARFVLRCLVARGGEPSDEAEGTAVASPILVNIV